MKTLRDYINLINEAPINIDVRGIQQDARVKAYQDAIAAGKSEAEAQNAEAAAGNLAGAEALQQQGDAAGLTGTPVATATPVAEPNVVATPIPAQAPVQAQPAAPKQWNKGVLGMGSRGQEVIDLQTKLGVTPDGAFGPATRDAVIALQKQLGVTPDGAYGPATRAAHEKQRSGSGAQPAAVPANQTAPNQVTQTQQTFNTTQGIAQGRIDPNSLRGQTTIQQPTTPTPPGNPSGVGKNATYTADEIAAAKEALKDPQISARDKAFYTSIVSSAAPATPAPAPVQTQPAPARTKVAPMPQMPAAGDPKALQAVQDWYNKYGKTHNPDGTPKVVKEMSKSDAKLLDQMLTIARLR